MRIQLKRLPSTLRGIYGRKRDRLGERMLYLAPDAADALLEFERRTGGAVYSDILRDASGSLKAVAAGKGAQAPGFSGHNYGLSVDIAIARTLKLRGWTYARLLEELSAHGWHCYVRDGSRGKEDWHFNYLGSAAEEILAKVDATKRATWKMAAELSITRRYLSQMALTPREQQSALAALGFYKGAIDGLFGPKSRAARERFEQTWDLNGSEARYQRTLAFLTATKEIT